MISEKRSPIFPKLPTLKEFGYDFANDAVFAVVAPAGITQDVAVKLEQSFAAATKSTEYLDALDKIGMIPVYYDGEKFSEFLRIHWKKINEHLIATGVIKEAATKPE